MSELTSGYRKLEKYKNLFKKTSNEQVQVKVEHKPEILCKDTEIAAYTGTKSKTICLYCTIIELYNFCEYLRVRNSEVVVHNINKTYATEKYDVKNLIMYKVGCIDYGIKEIQGKEQLDNATIREEKYIVRNDGPNIVILEKSKRYTEHTKVNSTKKAKVRHDDKPVSKVEDRLNIVEINKKIVRINSEQQIDILNLGKKVAENKATRQRINIATTCKYKKIDGKVGVLLASILDKLYRKIKIDYVLEKENEK
ncbi:38838_t:CDS:2 [Gigaspora margarita]|uniref:38838_t:CDS:1 n=1 Tax=Gigaspora margarita TaxID=4874 RepID=A0ABN7V3E6_GIGMA|nr:38838_t:CDS:2 [Gigaspora margarita]